MYVVIASGAVLSAIMVGIGATANKSVLNVV